MKPKLAHHSVSFPTPLLQWVREEAKSKGMSVNSFLNMTVSMAQQTDVLMQIRRLNYRVTELERKLTSGL